MIRYINAKDLAEMTGSSRATASKIVKQINTELAQAGHIVPNQWRVPEKVALERLGIKENQ